MNATAPTPGLFITGTDTNVGKTVATCAIAAALRNSGSRVGVCKPIASGCRNEREGLVSDDAEAIAHFADCRAPLNVINPVRYLPPVAPSVAIEQSGQPIDDAAIRHSLNTLSANHDVLLVEGVGGIMVPLDDKRTVIDLARMVGYPVVVVCRPNLGTLNHTALTCQAIRGAGLRLAGLVINGYVTDNHDASIADNPRWLAKQNKTKVLATLPQGDNVSPHTGVLSEDILSAARLMDWLAVAKHAR